MAKQVFLAVGTKFSGFCDTQTRMVGDLFLSHALHVI